MTTGERKDLKNFESNLTSKFPYSPVFDPKHYSASIAENASIGASVLQVRFKAFHFQNCSYNIKFIIRSLQLISMKVQMDAFDFL